VLKCGGLVEGKVGGNVAVYFCTPALEVIHAVAGNVDASTLLRAAEWSEQVWKGLQSLPASVHRDVVRIAHARAGLQDPLIELIHGRWAGRERAIAPCRSRARTEVVRLGLPAADHGGTVHRLLAARPLPALSEIYRHVFEKILGEQVSDNDVAEVDVTDSRRIRTAGILLRTGLETRITK